jgi:transcriptional regulator with XRE-family HTH domain
MENEGVIDQFIILRKSLKFTQNDLSGLSGVPQKTISQIENGHFNPTVAMMLKLLKPMEATLKIIEKDGKML